MGAEDKWNNETFSERVGPTGAAMTITHRVTLSCNLLTSGLFVTLSTARKIEQDKLEMRGLSLMKKIWRNL